MIAALVLALVSAAPASAHGSDVLRPEAVWRAWSLDPVAVLPLLATLWLYGRGARRLWARAGGGRGLTRAQAASFVAGVTVLIVAVVSPLDALGHTLSRPTWSSTASWLRWPRRSWPSAGRVWRWRGRFPSAGGAAPGPSGR